MHLVFSFQAPIVGTRWSPFRAYGMLQTQLYHCLYYPRCVAERLISLFTYLQPA